MSYLHPHLEVLPKPQRELWPKLAAIHGCGFVLYGGTAVALRCGHRSSVDFDFFSSSELDKARLRAIMPVLAQGQTVQDTPRTLTMLVPSAESHVKVSFFGGLRLGRVDDPQMTDDRVCEVASPADLLAMKLKVLFDRVEAKDYQDIIALLAAGETLEQGLGAGRALFGEEFQSAEVLKFLTDFQGGDLSELSTQDREFLRERVRLTQRIELPTIRSHTLSLEPGRNCGLSLDM